MNGYKKLEIRNNTKTSGFPKFVVDTKSSSGSVKLEAHALLFVGNLYPEKGLVIAFPRDRATQQIKLIETPSKAPCLLAFGTSKPRKKRPTRGPAMQPSIFVAAWIIPPRGWAAKAKAALEEP